jgi:hypothetical protein
VVIGFGALAESKLRLPDGLVVDRSKLNLGKADNDVASLHLEDEERPTLSHPDILIVRRFRRVGARVRSTCQAPPACYAAYRFFPTCSRPPLLAKTKTPVNSNAIRMFMTTSSSASTP